uniref:Ig-like domain-containing protein n=1 Tax=Neolamprologus brichardi TaxID=32507 RepID=A0A3Q4MMI7_NEOBR
MLVVGLLLSSKVKMPENINVLRGSCVTIPCSFDVENTHEKNLDDSCKAYWSDSTSFNSKDAKLKPTKEMTGDLTKKDCTTTFNNANLLQSTKYYFRLECNNGLIWTFIQPDPPSPTLTPSTLEVKEGASVSLTCSAPAPCWSHPPALTWSPNLGQSQETLQENQDKTKVKTSVMSFTASHLHHGNKISCTAVNQKQDGSPDVTAETSLTPDISCEFICVAEKSKCLTCSTNANPPVWNYTWYRADGDQETFIGTGTSLNIHVFRDRRSFFCKAGNEIGVGCSISIQIDVQCKYHISHLLYISSVLPSIKESLEQSFIHYVFPILKSIYANAERLREAGIVDPKVVAEPSSTNLPSAEPVGAGGSKNSKNKGDKCEAIYSSVNWKTRSKKKKEETSVDFNSPGCYYLEEEKCIVEGINRNFVSNALEMGGLYDEVGGKNVKKEVECEYAQVKFKDKTKMPK